MSVEVHKVRDSTADSPLQRPEALCDTDGEPTDPVSLIEVKQEPKEENEMKSFAQSTMNELLGLYGYEHVAEAELNRYGSSSMNTSQNGSEEDSLSPENCEDHRETAQKQAVRRKRFDRRTQAVALAKMMDTATSKRLMKSMTFSSNQRTGKESLISTNSTSSPVQGSYEDEVLCSWCRKPGRSALTLQENDENKTFCSEKCFAACRRAKFKRTRVCDWCKQVRQVREYLENSQSDGRLQFCSTECLENYKMAVFCSEINSNDKTKTDRSASQTPSPHNEKSPGKKCNSSADLMDLRVRTSPSSESVEDARSYGDAFATKNGLSSKQMNPVSSNTKAKYNKTREVESKPHSRNKGHQERSATKRNIGDISSGRRSVTSPRLSKDKSGYQFGKNVYLMSSANKPPTSGKKESKFYPQWTPDRSRMENPVTSPSGLLDCQVKGVGLNSLNFPMLANNYVSPSYQNMHIIQNLANAGVLSCGNNANVLPNLATRFPAGANITNGLFPGVPDRPPNVDNFDASSFILGMLAASSNKNDIPMPAEVGKSQQEARKWSVNSEVSSAPHTSEIVKNERHAQISQSLIPSNSDRSDLVPRNNASSTTHINGNEKNCPKTSETEKQKNTSSLPFPMLLIPFPVPLPIPIPIPQFSLTRRSAEEKSGDNKSIGSENVTTFNKNCRKEDVDSERSDPGLDQCCSVMDLSCKSKRSSPFSSPGSNCSVGDETTDGTRDVCEDQPFKKAKLST